MNIHDGWASISVRLKGSPSLIASLPISLLALGKLSGNDSVLLLSLDHKPGATMQEQLSALHDFLEEHQLLLSDLPEGCAMDVFLGWSPKAPQEALTLDGALIRILAALDADVVFDTYSD